MKAKKYSQGGEIKPNRNYRDRTRNNTGNVGPGKLKKMKTGGLCRGMGAATKGGTFGRNG